MSRPLLLDLFSGAGGAAMGYHRAGFDVVGVDNVVQWDFPFGFYCRDAIDVLDGRGPPRLDAFDAVHASPPCPRYAATKSLHPDADHPDLLMPVIDRLRDWGRPFVVENVEGAPYPDDLFRVMLCGSMFGLRVRRHRWFVSNVLLMPPGPCQHATQRDVLGVYGHSSPPSFTGQRGPRQATTAEARDVMGMPWATRRLGITNAIPPVYTEWIGRQLLAALEVAA